jgi:hypothetical protein
VTLVDVENAKEQLLVSWYWLDLRGGHSFGLPTDAVTKQIAASLVE